MKPTTPTCSINNKICYSSKQDAIKALNLFKNKNSNPNKKVRAVYKCGHCGDYHLTSVSKRVSKLLTEKGMPTKVPTPDLIESRLSFLKKKNKGC